MAKSFVLTAQLNIQAPTNLRPVIQSIQQQLGSVRVNIDVRIDPAAATRVAALNTQLTQLSRTLTSITASTTAIRGLSTALGGLSTSVSTTSRAVTSQANAFTKTKNSIQEARTEIEAFGFQSALAIRRFAAFSVGTAGILGLVGAFKSGITEAIKFDREMVKLSQVTGISVRGLKGVNDEIGRLATTFGVSSTALLDVSTTLAQAGLSARETKVALEALAKSALAPSFDNLTDTTEGVIASMRQFSLQASDVESALGSINAVSAAYAVESADIITAIRTTGGVFASASKGVKEGKDALNQFIAVFTSVRATTRESAESIATGLRTIFTRIQRPRTIEYLKEFGINLQDLEGKFVGPYEAIKRLSEGLRELDTRDSRFAQITEELGGYRQLSKVIPAIQQFATAQQALQVATAGSNSLSKDAAIAQQALAVQITKTKEGFLDLVRSFAQSTTFTNLISGTLKLADSFIAIGNALRPILPYLTILAGIKLSSSLFQFGSGFAGGIKRGGGAGGAGSGLAALITGNRGFATGGLVPGYGNSDSYPADLTPGEFVIRKSAVKALGVDTLDNLNKYAGGIGPPKTNPSARDLMNFTDAVNPKGLSRSQYYALSDDAKLSLKNRYLAAGQGIASPAEEPAAVTKKLTPRNLTVDGPYGGLFFQLGSKSGNVNTGPVSINSKNLSEGDQAKLAELYPQHKIGRISGQPYQFYVNKQKGEQFKKLAEDSMNKVIDNILSTAGGADAVSQGIGKPIGETKEIMKKQIGFSAFAGNMFEAYIGAVGRQLNPERSRSFDFNPVNPEFQQLFGPNVGQAKYADAKLSATSKSLPSILKKAVTAKLSGANEIIFRLGSANADAVAARSGKIESALGDTSNIRRTGRATGGQVGSVKSLLTPGEYVMGASAAKILGPATLNKLNNADRVGFFDGGDPIAVAQKKFDEEYRRLRSNNDKSALRSDANRDATIRQNVADLMAANPGMSPKEAYRITKRGVGKGPKIYDSLSVPANLADKAAQINNRSDVAYLRGSNAFRFPDENLSLRYSKGNPVAIPGQTASATPIAAGYGFTPESGTAPPSGPPSSPPGGGGGPPSGPINPYIPNSKVPRRFDAIRSRISNFTSGGNIGSRLAAAGPTAAFLAAPLAQQTIGGPTGSAISGGLAAGAAAGSIGGPMGAVFGGAIGAVTSFANSIKEVELAKDLKDVGDAATGLQKKFDDFNVGKATSQELNNSIGAASRSINRDRNNSLFTGGTSIRNFVGGEDRLRQSDAFGGGLSGAIGNSLSKKFDTASERQAKIGGFVEQRQSEQLVNRQPIAAAAEGFFNKRFGNAQFGSGNEDFKNDDAVRALAYSGPDAAKNNKILSSLEGVAKNTKERELGEARVKTLEKEFKALQNLKSSSEAVTQNIEILAQSFDKVSAGVTRALAESDKRSIATEDLLGQSAGAARVGRVASGIDVFTNNKGYSLDETRGAIAGLGLNSGSTKKLTDTTLSTKALAADLPKYLLDTFSKENFADTSPVIAAERGIDDILKKNKLDPNSLPPELRDRIKSSVKTSLGNQQDSSQDFGDFIATFTKDLEAIGAGALKAGEDLQRGLEAANNKYLEGINQYIGASLRVEEQKASNASADNADQIAQLRLNSTYRDPTGFDAGYAELGQITELTKSAANPIGLRSASDIGLNLDSLDAKRNQIQAQRAATPINDTAGQASLAKSLAQVEVEIAKNSKALDIAADASGELAGITAELTRIEASRKDAQNQLSETQITRREAREAQKGAAIFDRVKNDPSVKLNRRDTDRLTKFGKAEQADLIGLGKFTEADDVATAVARKSLEFKKNNGLLRNKTQEDFLTQGIVGANQSKEAKDLEAGASDRFDDRRRARDIRVRRAEKPLSGVLDNLDKQNTETSDKVRAAGNKLVPDSFSGDVAALQKAADTLAAMPKTITMEGTHQVNVNITGLAGTNLEGVLGDFVKGEINKAMKQYVPQDQRLEQGNQFMKVV